MAELTQESNEEISQGQEEESGENFDVFEQEQERAQELEIAKLLDRRSASRAKNLVQKTKSLIRGRNIGLANTMLLYVMAAIAAFLDIIPLVSASLAFIVDWILDIGFYFLMLVTMILASGKPISSIFGFRGALNLTTLVLEALPATEIPPWHLLMVLLVYLDAKYGILSLWRIYKKYKEMNQKEIAAEAEKIINKLRS